MTHEADGAIEIPLYQVDAFTDRVFYGNPAAVCPLQEWLPRDVMQAIALENNLPETAFILPVGDGYELRWFTPATEVELCGHATLAAAHVVFSRLRPDLRQVIFHSASGPLVVDRNGQRMTLCFPALEYTPTEPPEALLRGLGGGHGVRAVYRSMDYVVVYDDEAQMRAVAPHPDALETLDLRGVVITAPGVSTHFSSRFFGPKLAIAEDPITGSAHCALVPYWAHRLGRTQLTARQFSPRLGVTLVIEIECALHGDRVLLTGAAKEFMAGTIRLTGVDLGQPEESTTARAS